MWKPGEVVAAAEPVGEYAFPEPEKALSRERIPRQEALLKEGLRIIGQLKDTYILCQAGDGLLLIDQHAAHERIVYENLKRSYQSSRIERQGFLIPPKLEFSLKDGAVLLKNLDRLAELGMEIEHFGGGTFLLRSVPSLLVNARWEAFLGELVPLLDEGVELPRERAVERLVTVMACHGAIRAGQRMTQQEMGALIKELEEMDLPTNCPHGRPVFKRFTYYEIEKMFKRVV
jgi:DNA mismatch repair protein MutL